MKNAFSSFSLGARRAAAAVISCQHRDFPPFQRPPGSATATLMRQSIQPPELGLRKRFLDRTSLKVPFFASQVRARSTSRQWSMEAHVNMPRTVSSAPDASVP